MLTGGQAPHRERAWHPLQGPAHSGPTSCHAISSQHFHQGERSGHQSGESSHDHMREPCMLLTLLLALQVPLACEMAAVH